jgi:hypothetical protein
MTRPSRPPRPSDRQANESHPCNPQPNARLPHLRVSRLHELCGVRVGGGECGDGLLLLAVCGGWGEG